VSTTPEDGISGAEAAEILGIQELSVSRLVSQGVLLKAVRGQKFGLERADVERVALERYRPGHAYWCTSGCAAEILGVSVTRVHQLVDRDFLPAVKHAGRWYFRRHQLEVIANARDARKLRGALGTGT
jgi:predicted XRE-type DNA-binding protein